VYMLLNPNKLMMYQEAELTLFLLATLLQYYLFLKAKCFTNFTMKHPK